MRKILFATLITLALTINIHTQEPQHESGVRVEVDLVRVDVLVMEKGIPVLGLTKDDFIVREDGEMQEVQYIASDPVPLSLELVIDTSGSVEPFFQKMKGLLDSALGLLSPNDEIALIGFDSSAHTYTKFTSNLKAFAKALNSLESTKRATDLSSGVALAVERLKTTSASRRRVAIIISDNEEFLKPQFDRRYIHEAASRHSVAVFSLRIGERIPSGMLAKDVTKAGVVFINTIVKKTGGEIIDARGEDPIKGLSLAIDRLRNTYSLYYSPPNPENHGLRKIKVELKENHRSGLLFRKKYKIISRKEYYF